MRSFGQALWGAEHSDASSSAPAPAKPKLRGFVLDLATGAPLANVPVSVWTEPDDGVRWPLARLVTDNACYLAVPTEGVNRQLDVVRGRGHHIKILAGALSKPAPAFVEALPHDQAILGKVSLPSVIDPDTIDAQLSRH